MKSRQVRIDYPRPNLIIRRFRTRRQYIFHSHRPIAKLITSIGRLGRNPLVPVPVPVPCPWETSGPTPGLGRNCRRWLCCGERAWFHTVAWTISPRLPASESPELEPTYAGASDELRARNPTSSPTALLSIPDVPPGWGVSWLWEASSDETGRAALLPALVVVVVAVPAAVDASDFWSLSSRSAIRPSSARVYLQEC